MYFPIFMMTHMHEKCMSSVMFNYLMFSSTSTKIAYSSTTQWSSYGLQDPNMKMCTLVVYPGPSSFPRIMSLKVVFQICFGSIKMMGTRGVLIRILQCTKFHELLINHVGEFVMTKCILNCLKISRSKEA
jgi:hypothetical protein